MTSKSPVRWPTEIIKQRAPSLSVVRSRPAKASPFAASKSVCVLCVDMVHLVVEHEKVRRKGHSRQLSQHRRELTSVIARMIHDVVHLTPERVLPGLPLEVYVMHERLEALGRERLEKRSLFDLDLQPSRLERARARKARALEDDLGRRPFPALKPDPFGPNDVRKG